MALRSFSTANSVLIARQISALFTRRGYAAAAAQGSVSSAERPIPISISPKLQGSEESGKASAAWGPDPVTGYYRPENRANEIDAAELRRIMLVKTGRH